MENLILTIITASTPLLLAAIGGLVAERSGVLNLGVEGMMAVGAVTGFAVAFTTGSPYLGALAAGAAGMMLSGLFGVLVLWLATNQVATGLALTLLGLGLSGLIGEPFVGQPGVKLERLAVPGLSDIPFLGPILFRQDVLVYISVALVAAVAYVLFHTRAGLVIRAVGNSHASSHALGYSVLGVRFGCVLFGGFCSGLAGGYLSLAYTPQWIENMTAGRGWIALALIVFASWRPWRVLAGAWLFGTVMILGLEAQARGVDLPSQLLSALPYLVTIAALVLISRSRRETLINTPADLGRPFVPER